MQSWFERAPEAQNILRQEAFCDPIFHPLSLLLGRDPCGDRILLSCLQKASRQHVRFLGPRTGTNRDKTAHFGTIGETPPLKIHPHLALLDFCWVKGCKTRLELQKPGVLARRFAPNTWEKCENGGLQGPVDLGVASGGGAFPIWPVSPFLPLFVPFGSRPIFFWDCPFFCRGLFCYVLFLLLGLSRGPKGPGRNQDLSQNI